MLGATTVIGVDVNEFKRGKGETFGMTHFVNPKQSDKSLPELIRELTGGMGVDYCFECTGVITLVNQAVESTKLVRRWFASFLYQRHRPFASFGMWYEYTNFRVQHLISIRERVQQS